MKMKLTNLLPLCLVCSLTGCGGGSSNGGGTTANIDITYDVVSVVEADDNSVDMVFDVQLNQAATEDITLNISTIDVTAITNRDYQLRSNSAVIAAGDIDVQIIVDVLPDPFIETDETFELVVDSSSPQVKSISDPVTATIVDNDDGKSQSIIYRRYASGTQSDLYIVQDDGSANTTLVDSTTSENYVATSVNGRIIFSRDGNYFSVKVDGSAEVQLTDTTNIKYYPYLTINGRLVYSERQFPLTKEDIFSVKDDGSGFVTLANSSDDEDVNAVTADGNVIYQHNNAGQYDIRIVSDQGGSSWALADDPGENEFYVGLTPAGRIIYNSQLAAAQADLYSVLQDGSDTQVLADSSTVDDEFVTVLPNERVLFRREVNPGDYDLYSVLSDGRAQVTLANEIGNEWFLTLTADNRVIYTHFNGSQSDIHIIDADGNNHHALADTLDDEYLSTTSSILDDGRVVFSRISNGQSDLYIVNPDGSGELRLTDTPDADEYVAYNSEIVAGRIVFQRESILPVSQGGSGSELGSIKSDGTDEVTLFNSEDSIDVSGVTDSGRVIFRTNNAGNLDLYSVNADGSNLVELANTSDSEYFLDIVF